MLISVDIRLRAVMVMPFEKWSTTFTTTVVLTRNDLFGCPLSTFAVSLPVLYWTFNTDYSQ